MFVTPPIVRRRPADAGAEPDEVVRCPLYRDGEIALGMCYDLQGIARASDPDEHPFVDDLRSAPVGRDGLDPRSVCLAHQREIAQWRVQACRDAGERGELEAFIEQIDESLAGKG